MYSKNDKVELFLSKKIKQSDKSAKLTVVNCKCKLI